MHPAWGQAIAPYTRPREADGRIIAGAALTFTGFLLQGLGWLFYFLGSFIASPIMFAMLGIGSILAAVGFLIAFVGLARPRA